MDELLEKEKKLRELEQESKSVCITRAQDKEYVEQGIKMRGGMVHVPSIS